MLKINVISCLVVFLLACDQDRALEVTLESAQNAASSITADELRAVVQEIASDAYEGRGPGTRGDEKTQAYLVAALKEIGLQGGATNGGYIQEVGLVSVNTEQPQTWSFGFEDQEIVFKKNDEFIAASGVQREQAVIDDAEVVFVGYGIQAPEYQWDDYAGANLKGKVLLMLNNDPDWDPNLFSGTTRQYYGRWTYKYESAAAQGAVGAIIIHTRDSAGYPWQVVQTSWTGPQFELPAEGEARSQVTGWLTENAAERLVRLANFELDELIQHARHRDFKPVPLGINTSLTLNNKIEHTASANVLGLLPGSDPVLKSEVVVYSAHHDHLGIGPENNTGDHIYNGAMDNATGVTAVLEIAEAFTKLDSAPKRSVLFALVAAEEQGLLGSQFYARHPTFAAGKIAANINFDGGNAIGPSSDIGFIGLGKSSLDDVAREVAGFQGRVVVGDSVPQQGLFYRSDQFNFAKIGVPATFVRGGSKIIGKPEGWGAEISLNYIANDYHQPSDEISPDWRFDGMVEDAQYGFYLGFLVANQLEMPAWNAGDEFEAARLKAITAAESE